MYRILSHEEFSVLITAKCGDADNVKPYILHMLEIAALEGDGNSHPQFSRA